MIKKVGPADRVKVDPTSLFENFDIHDLSTRLRCFDHCSLCLFKLCFHVHYVELVIFKPKTRRYMKRGTQKVVLCKRVKVFI